MSRTTGENEMDLHRILDALRIASTLILLLHFYLIGRDGPETGNPIIQRLTDVLGQIPVVSDPIGGKCLAFLLLGVSLLGASGKKSPEYRMQAGLLWGLGGLGFYFGSSLVAGTGLFYFVVCSAGWLLILHAGNYLSRVIWHKQKEDVFNRLHESFPQEERSLRIPGSVNLPAHYQYHGKTIPSWINFVAPQRGTLILGSPGSGKTLALQHFIRQMIQKGYAMVLHDFKYDDLSRLAYNCFLRYRNQYPAKAGFYNIQFDDLERSHRCNLLHPSTLSDINGAEEASRALLLGLNMDWIARQGDFFVDSAIALVKALIWYLRLYKDGIFCSWPHVIELAQTPKNKLFTLLQAEPELQAIVRLFIEALTEDSSDQLSGQLASAMIGLSKLASPTMYYVLTGNDLTLDVNNPEAPKVVTIGNNPQKSGVYGPLIAAYLNAINRLANRKGAHPMAEILEEFSTISVHTIDRTIATGRSNGIAVVLCLQNINQLRHTYGDKFADVVLNTCGNILSGQVTGDSAKLLAERFGRTLQDRQSLTASYSDVQVTDSSQLEPVIPESRIASLSPGEFVGMVADTPDQPIALKAFCCRMEMDFSALDAEEKGFQILPIVRRLAPGEVDENFRRIRGEVQLLVESEYDRISSSPDLSHFVVTGKSKEL